MNIRKDNIDDLNAVVTVKIEKPDYEERVDNILKDYRKKARIDGFRPGKVPQGLINKMYRKPVLVEEINKIVGESLNKFLVDEKINILGDPLPNLEKPLDINWDQDKEFEFSFDLGLSPELDFGVSEKDKIPYYLISITDEERNKHIDRIRSRFGTFKEVSEVTENEMIRADLVELDKQGSPVENGIKAEEATILLEFIKDSKIKKMFKGCKPGDQLIINVKKAFENEIDLAALLKVDKARLPEISPDFSVILKSVSKFEKPEVNQELFDKLYGKETVKSEDEFKQKVDEELKAVFENSSDIKFRIDTKNFYMQKFKQKLPVEFLKRWLLLSNDGKITKDIVEKEYEKFETDLKWQLIKSKIIHENDLKITEQELLEHVKEVMKQQFVQYYGIAEVPSDLIEKYARESLTRPEEHNKYAQNLYESKVFEFIRKVIKLDSKELTLEKFNKLIEKNS
jgi:trigger factor